MNMTVIGRGKVGGRALEDHLSLVFAASRSLGGPVFYRFGRPGEL